MTKQRVGLAAGASVVIAALTAVFAMTGLAPELSAALQTVATIVLVAVTWRYVSLTRSLVAAQEAALELARAEQQRATEQVRRQVTENAMRELWTKCSPQSFQLSRLADLLAELSSESDPEQFVNRADRMATEADEVRPLADLLVALAADLPEDLEREAWEAATLILRAISEMQSVSLSSLRAQRRAREEDRQLDVEQIAADFTTKERPTLTGKPEWSDVLTGETFRKADAAVDALEKRAYARLRPGGRAEGEAAASLE